jgi:flagellar protein FliS
MMQQHQAYKTNSVNTATPQELTLMLYNGCLKFMRQAKKAMEEKDIPAKNNNIQRAQDIISELIITLDHNAPIAKDILPLYEFINRRLIDANIKNDPEILMEAYALVEDFRNTWKEVMKQAKTMQYSQGAKA